MQVKTIDLREADFAAHLIDSITNTGFAVVKGHSVDTYLINSVHGEWKEFFMENEESKKMYLFTEESQTGYYPYRSETAKGQTVSDLKEFYHYYSKDYLPERISSSTGILFKELNNLGSMILDILSNGYKEQTYNFSNMCKESKGTLFRPIYYPSIKGNEDGVRAAAHGDINFITLLPAATAPGLQVQDIEGNWHDVKCDPESIVINVGDMLEMITKGFYKSTTHRVKNPDNNTDRISTPLFIHAHPDTVLSPHHTAKTYLDERLSELGLK